MNENYKRKILIIVGPTAVGKTEFSIAAAKANNGEIISADSMQLYKFMDIGSAKPTAYERNEAIHHLIDQVDPRDEFSVATYQSLAKSAIEEVFSKGKLPIISGGTGLYVNSLIYDMDFTAVPKVSEYRKTLELEAEKFGTEYLHKKLEKLDKTCAERIHPNNTKKIIRALEVFESTGNPIKSFEKSFVKTTDYNYKLVGLNRDRAKLYDRINLRVDKLLEAGLINEVKSLLEMGLTESNISMKGIGYKEIIGYLNGEYNQEYAVYLIKRNSRNYAKRQLTWFRRYDDIEWFEIDENAGVEEFLKWL